MQRDPRLIALLSKGEGQKRTGQKSGIRCAANGATYCGRD